MTCCASLCCLSSDGLLCVTSEVIERDDMLCLIVLSVHNDGLLCVTSEWIE